MDDRMVFSFLAAIMPDRNRTIRRRLSITGWLMRSRERQNLRNVSDESLKDCGLTRRDIEAEIRRLRW
jgi:uncharacterized protein YjiS (DUF1127 family)